MRPPELRAFACPSCHGSLIQHPLHGADSFVLECGRCRLRFPAPGGFVMFTESAPPDGTAPAEFLKGVEARVLPGVGIPGGFEEFCEAKRRRGLIDAYAGWAPFNESSRTPLSFVPFLREALRPGEVILDLSSRSGWSGEFLAGLFPGQTVISAWEGNKDCLGYRGYREWLPRGKRAPNLEIVFFDPREPWPLADGSVRFVHGYDVLHDVALEGLWAELERVTGKNGILLFPHVHLRNTGHEPEFERHGTMRGAGEYREFFGKCLAGTERRACVLGEATLFREQKAGGARRPLGDDLATTDYNAVVAVVPAGWIGRPLVAPPPPGDSAAVLQNPLFDVSLADGSVTVSRAEGLAEMPSRHPVYAELIPAALEPPLDPRSRLAHYWAGHVATLEQIAERMGEAPAALIPLLAELERRELVRRVVLSEAGFRLQRFHGRLEDAPLPHKDDLPGAWRGAVKRFANRVYIVDDSDGGRLTYAEADRIVGAIARRLRAAGIGPGDRLALCAPQHFEGMLLVWGAAHVGASLAVHDVALPPAVVEQRLRRTRPVLLFASEALAASLPGGAPCPTILLDPFGGAPPPHAGSKPTLMAWLRDEDFEGPPVESPPGLANAVAVVLFTSGTTGEARGVALSQSALAHSGRLMARLFGWTHDDVHICPGDLHTLGGLRNPAISTVHVGASTVVTTPDVRANSVRLAESMARQRVTLINATPALLRLLTSWSDRLPAGALATVRHVIVAGSAYTSGVRAAFERTFRVRTSNCYGLTETAGLCISENPQMTRLAEERSSDDIGIAADAVLRVVDERGNDVAPGAEGELLVHSANIFKEYLDNPAATADAFRGPWFRTRDRARLMQDGSCRLAGRMRDAIKNAHSEFVTVQEVQEALDALPEIADSGVGAWSDANGQEHLGAIVVARRPLSDEAATQAFLTELRRRLQVFLGPKRMPSRIVVRESVPRNSNGKVATGPGMERILNDE